VSLGPCSLEAGCTSRPVNFIETLESFLSDVCVLLYVSTFLCEVTSGNCPVLFVPCSAGVSFAKLLPFYRFPNKKIGGGWSEVGWCVNFSDLSKTQRKIENYLKIAFVIVHK
jgi:hypothetical protein